MKNTYFKKAAATAALLISLYSLSHAQPFGFRYGGRLGMGQSFIESDGKQMDDKLLLSGGIAANFQFTSFLGLTTDFLVTTKGAKTEGVTNDRNFFGEEQAYKYHDNYSLIYGEIPLLAKVSIGAVGLYLKAYGGPSMNFKMVDMETREYEDANYNAAHGYQMQRIQEAETIEYSLVYGGGIDVLTPVGGKLFFLDVRWSNGMTPFAKINNKDAFNKYFCVSVGYMFQ